MLKCHSPNRLLAPSTLKFSVTLQCRSARGTSMTNGGRQAWVPLSESTIYVRLTKDEIYKYHFPTGILKCASLVESPLPVASWLEVNYGRRRISLPLQTHRGRGVFIQTCTQTSGRGGFQIQVTDTRQILTKMSPTLITFLESSSSTADEAIGAREASLTNRVSFYIEDRKAVPTTKCGSQVLVGCSVALEPLKLWAHLPLGAD